MPGMTSRRPSVFIRLRQARGFWVLMLMALSLKVIAGTLCLADDMSPVAGSWSVESVASMATNPDAEACVLGEAACHCDCAHATALPATQVLLVRAVPATDAIAFETAAYRHRAPPLPQRPPIA
jgi:hypothetical protein